ncbi:MAG: glycosyltransferase family 2 protein, partial [Flavobacteriales bacterium]|nr:glycosyltransferase family 2 protein [Flavobacteriales bacterium]
MNKDYKLSIIVPIYNRPDELDELLHSIYMARIPDGVSLEIVVIEDGSAVKSDAVCKRWEEKINIKYFAKENTGPGASRNYGMERATGDYFVILDSDCLIPEDYFITLYGIIQKDDAPDAISGPDRAHHSFTDVQKAINYAMTSFYTTGGLRGGKN